MQYTPPKPKAIGAPTRTKASEAPSPSIMGFEPDALEKTAHFSAWEKLTGGRCNDEPPKLSRKAQRLLDAKERRKDNPTQAMIKDVLKGKKRVLIDRAKARSLKREALRDENTPEARKALRKMSDSWQGRVPRNVQGFYKVKNAKPRAIATLP